MALSDVTGQAQPDLSRPGFFDFQLNGMATAKQMDRLIDLTATLAKRITKNKDTPEGKAELERINALRESSAEIRKTSEANEELKQSTRDLSDEFNLLERVTTGGIKGISSFSYFLGRNSVLALGLTGFGTTLGALNGYADSLGKAMQMGVAGNVMTFASASKTAGLKLESFTKALTETGGGFASLGNNATDGAMQFGTLVESVRKSTYQFGNLGLSMDDLAVFTAQQVKVAVSQGFKGKQAQEQVRINSVALAKDLSNLSERTGKSVTELAAAANKLATDPLIATMVATTRESRAEVSKAVAGFGASMRGVFGEAGDILASDALKSAAAGLPLALTEAGKNLLIASSPLYNEFTKLAQGVQQGRQVTEEDRDRLRNLAEQEVQQRGQQIKTLSMLEGPAGDAARQILKLAEEARFYNTTEGKERKKQIDAARKFVAERNRLEANLQQALLPLIEVLNSIDWNFFYGVLNGFAIALQTVLKVLNPVAKLLSATGVGSLIGGLLALTGIVGVTVGAMRALSGIVGAAKSIFGAGQTPGGLKDLFGRRANGQSATTPLWVRSADTLLGGNNRTVVGGMTQGQSDRYKELRKKGLSPAEARRQAMQKESMTKRFIGDIGPGKLAVGGLLAGSAVGMIGDKIGGDASTFMNLIGSGIDIATVAGLYKAYGKRGVESLVKSSGLRGRLGVTLYKNAGKIAGGGAGAIIGGTAAQAVMGDAQTNAGTAGNIAGSIGGGVLGGMAAGRILGGVLGAWAGPVGVAIGSTAGGIMGQFIGDKLFGDDVTDTAVSANDTIYTDREKAAAETASLNAKVAELVDYQRAANSINAQALNYQRDTSRNIKNMPLPS